MHGHAGLHQLEHLRKTRIYRLIIINYCRFLADNELGTCRTDLREELNRSGECWSASDEDSPACLLDQGPHELGSLGAVGLQGMALITYDHPKAVMYTRYI